MDICSALSGRSINARSRRGRRFSAVGCFALRESLIFKSVYLLRCLCTNGLISITFDVGGDPSSKLRVFISMSRPVNAIKQNRARIRHLLSGRLSGNPQGAHLKHTTRMYMPASVSVCCACFYAHECVPVFLHARVSVREDIGRWNEGRRIFLACTLPHQLVRI